MSALQGLQDKIRRLELERSHAEDNLRTLATETSRYRDILREDRSIGSEREEPNTTVDGKREGLRLTREQYDTRLALGETTLGADTTQGTG